MSTVAKFMIIACADNRPPMLDKPMYESWKSRMELYIQGKDHRRIILNSIEKGLLIWPIVEQEDGTVRLKTYEELSDKAKLQADCDLKATNIVLQGLPPDVYSLVNHHKVAKEIWDKVKLLMQGTSLSKQERECKLYDEFDKFSHVKGETLYEYYLRFAQLINDMNIIQMTTQPVQVNTKFLNSLPPEWGKIMIDIKLARDLHTSNYDKLYSYLEQHEAHGNEARLMRERFPDPLALFSPPTQHVYSSPPQLNPYEAPHHPQQYPNTYPTNLTHTQPSVTQHAYLPPTIPQQPQAEFPQLDSGLVVPPFLPGDDQIACMNKSMTFLSAVFSPRYPSTNNQLISSSNPRNQATVQDGRVIVQQVQGRQGEWHIARHCTQPKRRRDATWFKEKVLLVQAHAEGKELDEEQLAFLEDPRVADGQVAQTITHNAALQSDDLDAYDSECDDISFAKAVLMANLSSCDSDVLSEVPYSNTFQNDMMNQSVQELQYSEQSPIVDYPDNEITSDINIIPYSQYLQERQHAIVQNTNTSAQQNSMILSMFEQMFNHATNWDKANNESKIVNESLTTELERYKERVKILEQRFNVDLSSYEKFIDSQMDDMIRMKNTKFAAFETEIDTLKQTLSKHVKEKESLLKTRNGFKMEFKQRESKSIDKEIVLENKNKELENIVYFGKRFVSQQELSVEQMFWLQSSNKNSKEPSTSNTLVKIEVPSELPKFDKGLHDEITEVQTVFTQIEAAVEQCSVDRKCYEIQQKQFLIKNDQLLDKIISQDIMTIVLNSFVAICDSKKKNNESVDICNKCLELEAEFVKNNDVYKRMMFILNFQNDKSCDNQNAPEIQEYFEQNDLQAQLQAKDTIISKLKEVIHSLRDNANPARVKQDIDEIEMINIELEHSVSKLLSKNEKLHKEKDHLKKTYKELYDSIKPTRVRAKEQCDSLISNLNSKSMENSDLKAQIQEKIFANAALKNELRKLKGKNVINTAVSKPNATIIALGMFKLDLEALASKVLKNKDAHIDYIKHSRNHADTLREIVKNARALSPLDCNSDSACKYVQRIQEVLVYIKDTCPCLTKTSEKLVVVTPKNKDKKVIFADPVTFSSNT
ncbi:hypothetical protein Tco_0618745 [Tanacetum coccineum]